MDSGRSQVFHVVSRVVDRNRVFEEEEKGQFLGMMRQLEGFSGVEVLTYCLMGNHFHLLVHVPKRPEEISDKEVRERMLKLYGKKKMAAKDKEIAERHEMGDHEFEKDLYDRMRARMYDLSQFVKDLKLWFSKWFNGVHERKGTLWEERFRSTLVEPEEGAMTRVAAYIELNPVRAGLVSEPHEYKWCSFAEATAGSSKARAGIIKASAGIGGSMSWDKASRQYRSYFLYKAVSQNHEKRGLSEEAYAEAMEGDGALSPGEKLRTRIRFLTEGVAIGSKAFLKEFFRDRQEDLGVGRKNFGFKMGTSEDSLFSYRKVE